MPGVLLALEPGDCVTPVRRRSDRTSFRVLLVEPEFITRFVETAFPDGGVKLSRGLLGDGAVTAFDAFWAGVRPAMAPLEQEGLLAAFLEAASDNTTAVAGASITPPIARAKKLLEDRFADDVRLEELEKEIGLSRFYLVRRFRAEVGMPPHAYPAGDTARSRARADRLGHGAVGSGVALRIHRSEPSDAPLPSCDGRLSRRLRPLGRRPSLIERIGRRPSERRLAPLTSGPHRGTYSVMVHLEAIMPALGANGDGHVHDYWWLILAPSSCSPSSLPLAYGSAAMAAARSDTKAPTASVRSLQA